MLRFLYFVQRILCSALDNLQLYIDKIEIRKGVKKAVEGFPNYYIYRDGRVYNNKTKKFLHLSKNTRGYMQINLFKDGDKKHYIKLIHQLVASAFIANPGTLKNVAHKNSILDDNRVENLYFCNQVENIRNSLRNLTHTRSGEFGNNAKLSFEDVRAIKKLLATGVSVKEISLLYDISQTNIYDIKNEKIWN